MSEDDVKTREKLERLSEQLAQVKRFQPESAAPAKLPGDAARSAIDFASATAAGTLLGYGWDAWQNTLPWGLLVGFFLGTATGIRMVFRHAARERAVAEANETNMKE